MDAKLYQRLASLMQAQLNCEASGNAEWRERHISTAERLVKEYMPSGSGIDSGTTLDVDASDANRLVFRTAFHHMNSDGYYDGWTEHSVTVRPSLANGYTLTISGRDRNDIKEYLHDTFSMALERVITADDIAHLYKERA